MSQFDSSITPNKNETMKAPQNRTFYIEVLSFSPLAQLCRWKEDNVCQSIWDKSEVLLGTLWGNMLGTCELFALTPLPFALKSKN
jgi:hypothetical protein